MSTAFDPDAGVLRLSHAALSVLARLAVTPTDPSLTDHATAPPLAELRGAGIVGPRGIHADVRPLAGVIGAPGATLDLEADDGAAVRRFRGWATPALLVVAVPTPAAPEVYDLMADVPAEAGGLLGELVGLAPGAATAADPVVLDRETFAALLDGRRDVGGSPLPAPVRMRWELVVRGASDGVLSVLDAEPGGLWRVEQDAQQVVLRPTDAAVLRARIDAAVAAALG